MNGFLGAQTFISAIVRVGKPNKALHLTALLRAEFRASFVIVEGLEQQATLQSRAAGELTVRHMKMFGGEIT